jgi:hypothetical protein
VILGDVFVEQDARFGLAQQPRQRSLPVQEREVAKILAIMLAVRVASRRDNSSNRDKPSGPSTIASPSIVKLLALIRSATAAMADSLAVQSLALRL